MATLFAVAFIAWVIIETSHDTIRSARGMEPRESRRGFGGYLDDRFRALAARHHANQARLDESGAPGWWARKRIEGRKIALAKAGFDTEEEIAKAADEHRRRMGLIRQGIDPDDVPAAPEVVERTARPDETPEPWTPWAPTQPEPTTSQETTVNTGEINSPADVKAFHADIAAAIAAGGIIADMLNGTMAQLEQRAADCSNNLANTETAAAGMRRLGMDDAAAAAEQLIEIQQAMAATLQQMAEALKTGSGQLTDQVGAAQGPLAVIDKAYMAQLTVADTRAGVGRGNLATDKFSDNG